MSQFTKELRQDIVREFAIRHNGQFNPTLFFEEVRDKGKKHPAYNWFEWDAGKAALAFQIEQARNFARDLRVTFKVEEVNGSHSVRIRQTPMPMVLSPLGGRSKGGGYLLVDPDDPDHIEEHCRQAAKALSQWFNRYQAALSQSGVKPVEIEKIVGRLEAGSIRKKPATKQIASRRAA